MQANVHKDSDYYIMTREFHLSFRSCDICIGFYVGTEQFPTEHWQILVNHKKFILNQIEGLMHNLFKSAKIPKLSTNLPLRTLPMKRSTSPFDDEGKTPWFCRYRTVWTYKTNQGTKISPPIMTNPGRCHEEGRWWFKNILHATVKYKPLVFSPSNQTNRRADTDADLPIPI